MTAALVLAGCAALLFGLEILEPGRQGAEGSPVPRRQTASGIQVAVDSLLRIRGIRPVDISTRRVRAAGGSFERVEQRVRVSPEWSSVELNRDLNRCLIPYGARVFATERSNESSVTMHIVREGVTLRSIVFTVDRKKGRESDPAAQ